MYSQIQKVSAMLFIFLIFSIILISMWIKKDIEKSEKQKMDEEIPEIEETEADI